MPDARQHLEVVELVPNGQDPGQRDASPPREMPDAAQLRDARRKELEEARMADRDGGSAGEPAPTVGKNGFRDGIARCRDRDHLRDRVPEPRA